MNRRSFLGKTLSSALGLAGVATALATPAAGQARPAVVLAPRKKRRKPSKKRKRRRRGRRLALVAVYLIRR